jgi:TrmH family RNA methyltransferase
MAFISSTSNPRVKYVRSLQARRRVRRAERRFVIEGVRLLEEALRANIPLLQLFYTQDAEATARGAAALAAAREVSSEVHLVTDAVMSALSDAEAPQGFVAVLPWPTPPLAERPDLILILDRLRDPGNLGTILRSAAGAGVEVVYLMSGTVDLYNPKVVRAAIGAHFRLPILTDVGWNGVRERCAGMMVYLAEASGDTPYFAVDWTALAALIIGGEATGASTEAGELATQRISIPMKGGLESLNAAMAATVILFEIARQRAVAMPSGPP